MYPQFAREQVFSWMIRSTEACCDYCEKRRAYEAFTKDLDLPDMGP